MSQPVAFVLKGYPRLSETFIAQEIHRLEQAGLAIRIVSLRHPTEAEVHPVHHDIRAPVTYLPEYLYQEAARVCRGWWAARRLAGYRRARGAWLRDLVRDPTPNRIRRFGQALVLARELPREVAHLHAHFIHTPASVARYCALIRGLSWSCSAHAKDVWTTPAWELREKLGECAWTTTCSKAAFETLAAHLPSQAQDAGQRAGAGRLSLIYHGLDFSRFPRTHAARPARDGSDAADPVILLSVGRAVRKKGFDVLIDALARLPATLHWRLVHIGGGAGLKRLRRRAERAGIGARVMWLGPRPQNEVLANYRAADLFVLASRVTRDGDRDGLPNVLLEAQSQGLACIASHLSAIPELIDDGLTGRLVRPDDPAALAAALTEVIAAPAGRLALGGAGEARVRARFSCDSGIARLMERFAAQRPVEAKPSGVGGRSPPAPEPEQAVSCGLPSTLP